MVVAGTWYLVVVDGRFEALMLKLLTLAEYANLKMMASQAPRAYLTCDGSINQSS
jgi:hypothetical protein